MIVFRHKNIELEYHGKLSLYRKGEFLPLKLCYNTTAGWWVGHDTFLSIYQLKKYIKK